MELIEIKGIGPKSSILLNKLGINSVMDLLLYFPFRYEIIKRSDISSLIQDEKIIIDGVVENIPSLFRYKLNRDKMNFRINTGECLVNVIIFNRGYLKNNLKIGTKIIIFGTFDKVRNTIIANDIRFGSLKETTEIEPIYHVTSGISSKQICEFVKNAFSYINKIESFIPDIFEKKYKFISTTESIKELHMPSSTCKFKDALARYKYEELFLFMLKMNHLKKRNKTILGLDRKTEYNLEDFISTIPFTLTDDQNKAITDIANDLKSKYRMNRLIQGDVGSGKTILSFVALYMNFTDGYQGALMAPTEILAVQHYNNIRKTMANYNISIELLTGKMKISDKKRIHQRIKEGTIDIIIGTHAIFEENIEYKSLGLVITDEQHRFGVVQRGNLKNKGIIPDILYMSATPIPRTYALSLYGDMDISSIKTMPSGRKEIITNIYKSSEINEILRRMYVELQNSHQIYVIAPLIEESEKLDFENIYELETKMNKAFGKKYNVAVLHGKMSSKEKDEIMDKYKNNEIQILISTTVIEVGVDVKNATMIVIFDADRFGLSTLHQLRGRVGRNDMQSYCILVSDKKVERLEVLEKTNDGFKVSEEDFRLRGSGDIFGIKQSGDMVFKLADIRLDYSILLKAKEDSEKFIENYIEFEENIKFKNILKG